MTTLPFRSTNDTVPIKKVSEMNLKELKARLRYMNNQLTFGVSDYLYIYGLECAIAEKLKKH